MQRTGWMCSMLVVLGVAMTGSGCASSAVIAAAGVTAGFGLAQGQAEAFIRGRLEAARMISLDQAIAATLACMDELELEVMTQRTDIDDSYIRGRANGREIKVHIVTDSPVITTFKIRVGMIGDQAVSRLVLSRIDYHLGIQHPLIPVEQSPVVAPRNSVFEADRANR